MNNSAYGIYENLNKRKILVIGDIILEKYVICHSLAISLDAPVPVVNKDDEKWVLGGAANLAVNINDMDGQVVLAGVVGTDYEGTRIKKTLNKLGIPMVLSMDSSRPTTVVENITADGQLIVNIIHGDYNEVPGRVFKEIVKIIIAMLDDIEYVLIADFDGGVVTRDLMEAIAHICRDKKVSAYMGSVYADYSKYQGIELLYTELTSLERRLGTKIKTILDMEKAAATVFDESNCKSLVINLGISGFILFLGESDIWIHIPTINLYETIP